MANLEARERQRTIGEPTTTSTSSKLTATEVGRHNTADSCWIIIDHSVYDVTKFLDFHPAGRKTLLQYAGKDATEVFYSLHRSSVLTKYGPKYFLGRLASAPPATNASAEIGGPEDTGETVMYGESPVHRPHWHSPPFYTDSHRSYRMAIRQFLKDELLPEATAGDFAGTIPPKETIKKLGKLGLLAAKIGPGPHMKGLNIFGVKGKDFDMFHELITHEEMAGLGSPAYQDGLGSGLIIGLPPVQHFGREELAQRVTQECIAGDKTICLAISEPFAGSDVANIQTTATKTPDGKHYIVSGVKKWITNGMFADYFVTAVRTGDAGIGGVSLLLIERSDGVTTEKIPVSYGSAAGTALIIFEDVKVPVENLLGEENRGFHVIMANFNHERWVIIVHIQGAMRRIVEECFKWCMQRSVFGKKLISQPVIREKLARIVAKVEAQQAWADSITYQMTKMNQMEQFMNLAGPIALLKMYSSRMVYEINDDAVQIFGGRGITMTGMGAYIERMQRAVKFGSILGGSEEIMADLAIRMATRSFPTTARL